MHSHSRLATAALLFASTASVGHALQNGQPVTRLSRRVGIAVRETEVGLAPNTRPVVSVFGPPGTSYLLFMEPVFPPSVVDASFQLTLPQGSFTTCVDVVNPVNVVTLNGSVTAPPGQTVGVIPIGGRQDLQLNFTISSAFAGSEVKWQAFAADPGSLGGDTVSNGELRRLELPVTRPDFSNYTTNVPGVAPPNFYIDIKQADVDDDGDPDTLLVAASGSHQLLMTTMPVLLQAPILTSNAATLFGIRSAPETSAAFADFNNDGHMDLVMVGPPTSPSHRQVSVYANLGETFANPQAHGVWNGFRDDSALVQYDPNLLNVPFDANDVETGDIDGDGLLDIVVACGLNPVTGEQNRLFLNKSQIGGKLVFVEVTATAFSQPWLDDSEDCKFADFDGDGDLDIIFANFDGPTGRIGEETIWENQSTVGAPLFKRVINNFANIQDESMAVCVADFNNDGKPDVYVGNWLATPGNSGGPPWGAPVPDRLLINTTVPGGPITFVDMSTGLPDNPNYTGPGTPIAPSGTIDVQAIDYDLDGDIDVVVASGSKGVSGANTFGIRMLRNRIVNPVPPNTGFMLDPGAFTGVSQAIDYSAIATGDWQTRWFDRDVGGATANQAPANGFVMLWKN